MRDKHERAVNPDDVGYSWELVDRSNYNHSETHSHCSIQTGLIVCKHSAGGGPGERSGSAFIFATLSNQRAGRGD